MFNHETYTRSKMDVKFQTHTILITTDVVASQFSFDLVTTQQPTSCSVGNTSPMCISNKKKDY